MLNNNQKKQQLQRNTLLYTALNVFERSARTALRNRYFIGVVIAIIAVACGAAIVSVSRLPAAFAWLIWVFATSYLSIALTVIGLLILLYGDFITTLHQANDFVRAGFCNGAGEPPMLTKKNITEKGIMVMTYCSKGLAVGDWIARQEQIASALNIAILDICAGDYKSEIVVHAVPGYHKLPDYAELISFHSDMPEHKIALGQGLLAPVYMDLQTTPHWLIGGSTGCGKSQALVTIIVQLILRDSVVYLADWKGGVDYGCAQSCTLVTTEEALLAVLQRLLRDMEERKQLFLDVRCRNFAEYNARYPEKALPREVLVIDEASAVFDTKGATKEQKDIIYEITRNVTMLGRLARFVGIHLIVSTQRADVDGVPGSIKSNLQGRICGHCADNQTSIVLLDDGTGTDIPAKPGRFLLRDGVHPDQMLQVYLATDWLLAALAGPPQDEEDECEDV